MCAGFILNSFNKTKRGLRLLSHPFPRWGERNMYPGTRRCITERYINPPDVSVRLGPIRRNTRRPGHYVVAPVDVPCGQAEEISLKPVQPPLPLAKAPKWGQSRRQGEVGYPHETL